VCVCARARARVRVRACVCVRACVRAWEREREISHEGTYMCVRIWYAGSRGPHVNIRNKYKSNVVWPELCTVSFLCKAQDLDAHLTKSEQPITLHFTAVLPWVSLHMKHGLIWSLRFDTQNVLGESVQTDGDN